MLALVDLVSGTVTNDKHGYDITIMAMPSAVRIVLWPVPNLRSGPTCEETSGAGNFSRLNCCIVSNTKDQ